MITKCSCGANQIRGDQHLPCERQAIHGELCQCRRGEGSDSEKLQVDQRPFSISERHTEKGRKQNYREQQSSHARLLPQMVRPVQKEHKSG